MRNYLRKNLLYRLTIKGIIENLELLCCYSTVVVVDYRVLLVHGLCVHSCAGVEKYD